MNTVPSPFPSFLQFLQTVAAKYGQKTAFSIFREGEWTTVSYVQLRDESFFFADELRKAGVNSGDRVVLLGSSSPEWMISFFGIILAGGTVVPVDPKLSASEIENILRHVEPALLLIEPTFREVARSYRSVSASPVKILILKRPDLRGISEVIEPSHLESEIAVISYTSGTLGNPKGVMLSGRALLFQVTEVGELDQQALQGKAEVAYSILPFNHLYGLSDSAMLSLYCGMELCIAHDLGPQEIARCLVDRKVTRILAVPLFVRMIRVGIQRKILEKLGARRKKIFDFFIRILAGSFLLPMKRAIFGSILKPLGGHLNQIVCGGAPLDRETYDFFSAIGVPVYDGYGMTETGPVITVNYPGFTRRGSVGRAIPGVEVRVEKDSDADQAGEIFTRGPHLMSGYYKMPSVTAETIDAQGWLRTGDLGFVDADGYLFLKGRKKSMIALGGGKKVLPEEIESVLACSAFKEVCVVGMTSDNGFEEIIAAVVIPAEHFILAHPEPSDLHRAVQLEVSKLCEPLSHFKRPHRVFVRTTPFPMTTSMKIKRTALVTELQADRK